MFAEAESVIISGGIRENSTEQREAANFKKIS